MKTSLFLAVIGFFAAVFLPVSSATAVDIIVPDAGFDDHVLNDVGDYIYIGDSSYTGAWKSDYGSGGAYIDYRYWIADGDLPARSGNLKAYPSEGETLTFDYIYQILDETFIEGATYTLSVWVGNAWPEQGYVDGWGLYFTGEDYTINLIEAHGLALSGDWEQISLVYTATAADAGKKIGIKMSGEEGESYIAFEDVTLSYEVPTVAKNPAPTDDADDVPATTTLTWTPGQGATAHDVYLGEVFADVNEATRSDDRGVLVEQGQNAATYDPPENLEFSKTYYWRIDEVEAGGTTVHKGVIWSFTVEPLALPVENVVATSNGTSDAGVGPERTVDGSGLNADDQHSTNAADMWLTAPGEEPLSIQYEFEQTHKLHEMLLWNYNETFELMLGFGIKNVTIAYSENGVDWTVLGERELAQATAQTDYTANTTIDFGGVAARFVRLMVNSGWGTKGQLFGLSEVRFLSIPAQAREPQPADGAADVSVATLLGWRAGREAVSHDVYLGADASALVLVDTVDTTRCTPDNLEFGLDYFWRVDEVNEADEVSVWEGGIWSFTTQQYAVIDDFESYNDDENRIYDAWLDGWVNETGSTVGYFEALALRQQRWRQRLRGGEGSGRHGSDRPRRRQPATVHFRPGAGLLRGHRWHTPHERNRQRHLERRRSIPLRLQATKRRWFYRCPRRLRRRQPRLLGQGRRNDSPEQGRRRRQHVHGHDRGQWWRCHLPAAYGRRRCLRLAAQLR